MKNSRVTKPSKYFIMGEIRSMAEENKALRILDLGSGRSRNWEGIINDFPGIEYVGIEPRIKDANNAREYFKGKSNVRIIDNFAEAETGLLDNHFDLVVSLSVLEHVKDLENFLKFSMKMVAQGGKLVHLYDLGHSLYPSCFKEKLQLYLCSTWFKKFIPKNRYVAYIDSDNVSLVLSSGGFKVDKITYNNMVGLVTLLKTAEIENIDEALLKVVAVEKEAAEITNDKKALEILLPAVCVWAHKE